MNSKLLMIEDPLVSTSAQLMSRLSALSVSNYYNPYVEFEWPEIQNDTFWMSPELLSVADTKYYDMLTEQQLQILSKWESINMYSMSVFGERDLIAGVLRNMHTARSKEEVEYFHHFIEEETKHMWLFTQFCNKYGGKVYEPKIFNVSTLPFDEKEILAFIAFAQILIFEEVGDFFNVRLQKDARLPSVVRALNRLHHQDESRHLAMGRALLKDRHGQVLEKYGVSGVARVESYLKKFMKMTLLGFYNPTVYQDAGLQDAYKVRSELVKSPARGLFHDQVLARVTRFLQSSGIFTTNTVEAS